MVLSFSLALVLVSVAFLDVKDAPEERKEKDQGNGKDMTCSMRYPHENVMHLEINP